MHNEKISSKMQCKIEREELMKTQSTEHLNDVRCGKEILLIELSLPLAEVCTSAKLSLINMAGKEGL